MNQWNLLIKLNKFEKDLHQVYGAELELLESIKWITVEKIR